MLNTVSYDVCNLNEIYTETYKYFLPQKQLKMLFEGNTNEGVPYTAAEQEDLSTDINELYQNILATRPPKNGKLAVITAGCRGSGKSTKLREELRWNQSRDRYYAFICPKNILKNMKLTYLKDCEKDKSETNKIAAAKKWLAGAYAAAHLILALLIKNNYDFYYGTTLSYPLTGCFLSFLKKNNYRIRILSVWAPEELCYNSVLKSDPPLLLSHEKEISERMEQCAFRLIDQILKYADEIDFYCREYEKAIMAIAWISKNDFEDGKNRIYVFNAIAHAKIKELHNKAIQDSKLSDKDLSWDVNIENLATVVSSIDSPGRSSK